jgi:SAM-dependent methyltransferase
MFVCPDCKTTLKELSCPRCKSEFHRVDGIPVLLSKRPEFKEVREIAALYDSLYTGASDVWGAMGRTTGEFLQYFTALLSRFPSRRVLEIGCGEGTLLAAIQAEDKAAIDLSPAAINAARSKTVGQFSVALAEALPFEDERFDLIVSIGVMEHFLDERRAFQEIRRVLKPGGHFVSLIHVRLTFWDRVALKIPMFFFPRPRPIALAQWVARKMKGGSIAQAANAIYQPIQRMYTTRSGKACFERYGFDVIDVLHTRRYPNLPLRDLYVVIYVGEKRLAEEQPLLQRSA